MTNNMTTLAGKFLRNCSPNTPVTVELITGQVSPGSATTDMSLLSLTVFQYSLTGGRSTAWAVYRTSNWTVGSREMNPFSFDRTELTIGRVSWSSSSYEVTISVSGNYYVYVSGGTRPNSAFGLTVQRNGNDVFGVYRTGTNWNGVDTLGHGLVIALNAGDRLKVVARQSTAGFSGPDGRHASFFGFLII